MPPIVHSPGTRITGFLPSLAAQPAIRLGAAVRRVTLCSPALRLLVRCGRDGFDGDRHQALVRIRQAAAPARGLAAAAIVALVDLYEAVRAGIPAARSARCAACSPSAMRFHCAAPVPAAGTGPTLPA